MWLSDVSHYLHPSFVIAYQVHYWQFLNLRDPSSSASIFVPSQVDWTLVGRGSSQHPVTAWWHHHLLMMAVQVASLAEAMAMYLVVNFSTAVPALARFQPDVDVALKTLQTCESAYSKITASHLLWPGYTYCQKASRSYTGVSKWWNCHPNLTTRRFLPNMNFFLPLWSC